MISNCFKLLLLVVLGLLFSGQGFTDSNRNKLTKNPFIKPSLVDVEADRTRTNSKQTHTLSNINLRATLSSDDGSLANVDGIMVFVGEKVKGYELIDVSEGSATFIKNGKKITLNVSEMHKKLK